VLWDGLCLFSEAIIVFGTAFIVFQWKLLCQGRLLLLFAWKLLCVVCGLLFSLGKFCVWDSLRCFFARKLLWVGWGLFRFSVEIIVFGIASVVVFFQSWKLLCVE